MASETDVGIFLEEVGFYDKLDENQFDYFRDELEKAFDWENLVRLYTDEKV